MILSRRFFPASPPPPPLLPLSPPPQGRGTDRRRGGRCRFRQAALVAAVSAVGVAPRVALAHTPPHPLSNFAPPTTALDPNVSLSVGPTTLISSGEWVTVAWSGIDSWRWPDAFVAAFSPGTVLDDPARIAEVAPIKYRFISASGPLSSEGTDRDVDPEDGQMLRGEPRVARGETVAQALRFRLLNLRDPEGYRFGLFTGGISNPVLVAKTEAPVIFAQPYEVRTARRGGNVHPTYWRRWIDIHWCYVHNTHRHS